MGFFFQKPNYSQMQQSFEVRTWNKKTLKQIGDIGIENFELDLKSRVDIQHLFRGLHHLYTDSSLRVQLFTLLEKELIPEPNRKLYHPRLQL